MVFGEGNNSNRGVSTRGYKHKGRLGKSSFQEQEVFEIRSRDCYSPNEDNGPLYSERTNTQLNKYFSWKEHPNAQTLDAILQTCKDMMDYAVSPFCMITLCLAKVREEKHQIVIGTPTWLTQPWYHLLLQMSIDYQVLIPMGSRTLTSPDGKAYPLIVNDTLQLSRWKVSEE